MKTKIPEIIGKTFTSLEEKKFEGLTREIIFTTNEGTKYRMFHPLDSTVVISVTNFAGNLQDLLNSPITIAEKTSNANDIYAKLFLPDSPLFEKEYYKSIWTHYRLGTDKSTIFICWLGEIKKDKTYKEGDKFAEVHFTID